MKKSNRRKSNSAFDDDDSDLDYEDIAPPQKKRVSSTKKKEKVIATWKEEEEIEGFTISTLDSPNGSDSVENSNKHPRENEEEASEGIAALLGLAAEVEVIPKKPHKNIFTDPAYSSSESEAKSKESRKHRKALVPVTYTYVSSDEDYESEVYEIEEDEIDDDLVLENEEAEYQPYSQRTMKKKEKERTKTPKRFSKPKRNIKKRTHYPDDSESSEFSPPPPTTTTTTTLRSTVPINPPPAIPSHLPGTVPVTDNNIANILNKESPKPIVKSSNSKKRNSSFPTILPGSQNLTTAGNVKNTWKRGATHVAIAQYIYSQQRSEPKPPIQSTISGIDPTLESKIFKEHAASYAKSPPPPPPLRNNGRQVPISNFPPPKFPPPPPPFSPQSSNSKHFPNAFPGNPFPPFQAPYPPYPPQSHFPSQTYPQFPPFPGTASNYHPPFPQFNSPMPQQQQQQQPPPPPPDVPKTSIRMIPYNMSHIMKSSSKSSNSSARKKDPIAASTSNLQLPAPLMPPPFQPRDNFTLRPLNLKR